MATSHGDGVTASPHDLVQAAGTATPPEGLRSQEPHQSSPHALLAGEDADSHVEGQQTTEVPSPVSPLSEDQHSTEQDQTQNETADPAPASVTPSSRAVSANSDSAETPEPREKVSLAGETRSIYQRIGTYTVTFTIVATIFVFAPLIFLGWMWLSDRSAHTWRRIMLDDFAKQAVTIAALVLTTALTFLGGVATAMIAAVSLEHHGVPIQDAAQVSIARFSNAGPHTFWISMFFRKTFIELPSRLLLICLLVTALASQFSATILLSDLGQGVVVGSPTTSTNTSGFSYAGAEYDANTEEFQSPTSPFFASPNYWTTDPTVFQAFAEYTEPGNPSDGVDDTGLTLRALLPFSDAAARQSVRNFTGMAPVFDTRVVCARPQLKSLRLDPNRTTGFVVYLEGNFSVPSSLPGLAATEPEVTFDCQLASPFQALNGSAQDRGKFWSICPLNASAGGLLPVLNPAINSSLELSYNDDSTSNAEHEKINSKGGTWSVDDGGWNVDIGNAYIIFNSANDGSSENVNASSKWSSDAAEGPWLNVNFQNSQNGDSTDPANTNPDCNPFTECWKTVFRMSVCYDALPIPVTYDHIQEFDITASAPSDRTEPSLRYDLKQRKFPTDSIRTQLAATNAAASPSDRGILSLTSAPSIFRRVNHLRQFYTPSTIYNLENPPLCFTTADCTSSDYLNVFNLTTYPWITPMIFYSLTDIAMCLGCTYPDALPQASTILSTLFSDTISTTNSPALALQAVLTSVLRLAYYSFLPSFDARSEVTVTAFESAQIPLRTRGLWAVVGISMLHLALCVVALVAFTTLTKVSSLMNAWQAVADVSERDDGLRSVLSRVGEKGDSDVAKWIESETEGGMKGRKFRLGSVDRGSGGEDG